jgi:hypothetical protein
MSWNLVRFAQLHSSQNQRIRCISHSVDDVFIDDVLHNLGDTQNNCRNNDTSLNKIVMCSGEWSVCQWIVLYINTWLRNWENYNLPCI